jgi:hypothetical protein
MVMNISWCVVEHKLAASDFRVLSRFYITEPGNGIQNCLKEERI